MATLYGGRLGRILKQFPNVDCIKCNSKQVQIISYLSGDPKWKCRKCKETFDKKFKDPNPEDDELKNFS